MEHRNESRRAFLCDSSKMIIAAGIATVVGAGKSFSQGKKAVGKTSIVLRIDPADAENAPLKTNGGAIYVQDPSNKDVPIIVYRKSETEVTAFSSKCSHKGGPVGLPGSNGIAICEWHKAEFDTNGEVKKGPATSHLTKYKAALVDGAIMVTL
jgi:nitrite reductase/ring-hydroxylating ferredoxin subunit